LQDTSSSSSGLSERGGVEPVAELAAAFRYVIPFEGLSAPADGATTDGEGALGCPPLFEARFPAFVRDGAAADDGVVARAGSTTMVPSGARCRFPINVEGGGKPTL
jgi:hypothetical protein